MSKKMLSLMITMVMALSILSLGTISVSGAAASLNYVVIDKSLGLDVGAELTAIPIFNVDDDNQYDGSEAVTYQWTSANIPAVVTNHGNNTANTTHYTNIAGATGQSYIIKASDRGKIIRVNATYKGAIKYSADCVAVGNILSMHSEVPPTFSLDRYVNDSTKTALVIGAGPTAANADLTRPFWDSNNGDQLKYVANGTNSMANLGQNDYSYSQSGQNNLFVASYELDSPVELDSILVETGRGHAHSAIPVVYIKVAYEDDLNTFKDWAHYKASYRDEPAANYDRLYLLNVKGDNSLIDPMDADKKVGKIQVTLYTYLRADGKLNNDGNVYRDDIAVRQISGFSKLVTDGPEIISVNSSLGVTLGIFELTNVMKGIKASDLLAGITTSSQTASVRIVNAGKNIEIAGGAYVDGTMLVELTPKQGSTKVYYSLVMPVDYFDTNFNNDIGKKSYRVGSTAYGNPAGSASLPAGWPAIYSTNTDAAAGNAQANLDAAAQYFEGLNDPIKNSGVGKLHNDGTQTSTSFQLTKTNFVAADTAGRVFAFEANVKAGDKNALKQIDLYLNGITGGTFPKPFIFQKNGIINIAGDNICEYDIDKWYNLVYVVDSVNRKISAYLNGERVVNSKSYTAAANLGVTRLSMFVDTAIPSGASSSPVGTFYFDDVKIYFVKDATYTGSYAQAISSANYTVLGKEGKLTVPVGAGGSVTVAQLLSNISLGAGYTANIFNSGTLVTSQNYSTTNVSDGMVLALNHADGSAFRMYTIACSEASKPLFYNKTDTGLTTPVGAIPQGLTDLVAVIDNIESPTAVMVMAVYENNILKRLVYDDTLSSGSLTAEISIAGITSPRVDVYLLDGFGGLKPLLSEKYSIK